MMNQELKEKEKKCFFCSDTCITREICCNNYACENCYQSIVAPRRKMAGMIEDDRVGVN